MAWADLHQDLLSMIANKLNLYEDFKAFGGVCRSWRSVAVKNNFCPVQVPWLLLPPPEDGDAVNNSCDFYSLTKGGMVHKVHLPEAGGKKILSSLGWLITMDKDSGDMELLHPLSRARIPLPSAREYKYFHMLGKAALSANPSDTDDYALMIVIGHPSLLAYWKPGNTAWFSIRRGHIEVLMCIRRGHLEEVQDLVYHCGHFYFSNRRGEIFSVDINGPDPSTPANLVGTIPSEVLAGKKGFYLAESGGHLLAVVKKLVHDDDQRSNPLGYVLVAHRHHGIDSSIFIDKPIYNYVITSFQVYRFDSNNKSWHLMNDLGGSSIFLSEQRSPVCVPRAAVAAIRADCIYFTDDTTSNFYTPKDDAGHRGIDMAVYNLKEERADTLYKGGTTKGRCFVCPPLWVIPSL